MDWLEVLDIERAISNVRKDLVGDWYRDPWSWPEYGHIIDGRVDVVSRRAAMSGLRRVAKLDVPKEGFGTRPAVVLEPIDRVLYQALVDRLSKGLIGDLPPWVFGWRLPRADPEAGRYSPNETEWDLYRGELSGLVATNQCGLKTDIVSCFASVPVDRLTEQIVGLIGNNKVVERLADILVSFDGIPGRKGLAQRSKASATLANLYLHRLDPVLAQHRKVVSDSEERGRLFAFFMNTGGATRWMDDIWIFGSDEATLRSAQVDLQDIAREAGLELNMGKTEVYEGPDLVDNALRVQHSAVDDALADDPPNLQPLEELLDRLIGNPQDAERSSIHFALERMRRNRMASRKVAIIDAAPRMPHGADHLARAFRDFGWWEELQEWFLEYERGPWGKFRWSVANFGAMFPSNRKVSPRLVSRFADLLLSRPPLPLFALVAQRLAAWDKGKAREVFRELLVVADHPFERRIIGLAALSAKEERSVVRAALKEYDENMLTLEMVELGGYRPLKVAPDFAADTERGK